MILLAIACLWIAADIFALVLWRWLLEHNRKAFNERFDT